MYAALMSWSGIALELILLVRAAKERLLAQYTSFYVYIGCVLVCQILRAYWRWATPAAYRNFYYWYSDAFLIVASFLVAFEIYRRVVAARPRLTRFAQTLLLSAMVGTVCLVFSSDVKGEFGSLPQFAASLGSDLRFIEGPLVGILVWMFRHYRIPAGRNLKGLIFGYCFLVAVDITNFVFLHNKSNEVSIFFAKLLGPTYLITLVIWCIGLWRFVPENLPQRDSEQQLKYNEHAELIRSTLNRMTNHVVRCIRP